MRTIRWEIESLDNGITLEDIDIGTKEAALYNNESKDDVYRLLGLWLYSELKDFEEAEKTIKTQITINLEEAI